MQTYSEHSMPSKSYKRNSRTLLSRVICVLSFGTVSTRALKLLKEKRAVVTPDQQSRLTRRMEGLTEAIRKMTQSINRDQRDYDKQVGKLASGRANLLETQLREVRGKLIKDRLDSKQEKLADMTKTMGELEKRMERYKTALTETPSKKTATPDVAKTETKDENASTDNTTDSSISDESTEA